MTTDMTPLPKTVGLILAGGRSRRMQGRDKALMSLHGEPLLTHVIRCLRPQVDVMALNSNIAPDNFDAYGLPVIPDHLPGFLGPLAGIHAGLRRYQEDYLMTVAVDLPFLPPDLVTRLHAELGTKACSYASHAEQHALAILWRPGLAANVANYLQCGGRSLKDFLSVNGQPVHFDRPQDRGLFHNINTPEDLARAEQPKQQQQ